jgi:site-specific DNA-methyltransferase (cytosine-N4-specific)
MRIAINPTGMISSLDKSPGNEKAGDWTFNGATTRELTHCYHDYPARMIPQVARKLLDLFGVNARLLFDPYCGTGTSLVEGMVKGINAVGTDLNPLARLIARAKTSTPDMGLLDEELNRYRRFVARSQKRSVLQLSFLEGIAQPDFWFKPDVVERLVRLKEFIDRIEAEPIQLFFQVAFSETVRESSNTRNDEFKLYRYSADHLREFNPDVFGIMTSKLNRNREGLQKFLSIIKTIEPPPSSRICDFNTVIQVPRDIITPASVDIVITSPPYGDSHTTVAYGQYSRLSAAWLGLTDPHKVDRELMGGKAAKGISHFPSTALNYAIQQIAEVDSKRALEVSAFYADLLNSIRHVSESMRPNGYACYVVGNRKVKGVVLPTDTTVRDFFEHCGFQYVDTFHRSIPNKRMPLRNSPTNVPSMLDDTMTQEHIVVMYRSRK